MSQNLFQNPQGGPPQQGGLFNQGQAGGGLFNQGQPQQQTQQTAMFGGGQQQQQPVGGLFSQQQTPPPMNFGQNPQQQGGQQQQQQPLFGQQTQQQGQQQQLGQPPQQQGLFPQQGQQQGQQQGLLPQQPQQGLQQQGQQLGQQSLGLGLTPQGQQPLQQQQNLLGTANPQQQNQQAQPAIPFRTLLEKGKKDTLKHIDNLIKAAEIKDAVEKNQEVIRSIDKNSIYPTQALAAVQQQPQLIGGMVNKQQQDQMKAQQQHQELLRQSVYTGKTIQNFRKYSDTGLRQLQRNQDDTLKSLNDMKSLLLTKLDGFATMHEEEENVCQQTQSMQDALEKVTSQLDDVIKMQKEIMVSLEDQGDNWEHSYKALYSCITQLNDEINETDDMLIQLEKHHKIIQR